MHAAAHTCFLRLGNQRLLDPLWSSRSISERLMPVQSDALKPLAKEWVTQIPMGRLAEVTDLEVRMHIIANWDAVCCMACVISRICQGQGIRRRPFHRARHRCPALPTSAVLHAAGRLLVRLQLRLHSKVAMESNA